MMALSITVPHVHLQVKWFLCVNYFLAILHSLFLDIHCQTVTPTVSEHADKGICMHR